MYVFLVFIFVVYNIIKYVVLPHSCFNGRIQVLIEEQLIKEFVHRVSTEETLRTALASDAKSVIEREGFSPRVTQVLMRLFPHLTMNQTAPLGWWI